MKRDAFISKNVTVLAHILQCGLCVGMVVNTSTRKQCILEGFWRYQSCQRWRRLWKCSSCVLEWSSIIYLWFHANSQCLSSKMSIIVETSSSWFYWCIVNFVIWILRTLIDLHFPSPLKLTITITTKCLNPDLHLYRSLTLKPSLDPWHKYTDLFFVLSRRFEFRLWKTFYK